MERTALGPNPPSTPPSQRSARRNLHLRVFSALGAHKWELAAGGVALLALLWGVGYGLPYSYYGDEAHFVRRSLAFGSGDLNPHWFHKPAFYMYFLFAEYIVYFAAGWLTGAWSTPDDFAVHYFSNPGPFHLIGRLTTVAFAFGCLFALYRIALRGLDRRTALLAPLFLVLTYGFVDSSQWVKADVPAACFALLSAWCLVSYLDSRRRVLILAAAALAGLGTATKFYPAVMLLPLSVAVWWRFRDQGVSRIRALFFTVRECVLAGCVFALAFFAGSPFSVLDPLGWEQSFGRLERFLAKVAAFFSVQNPDEVVPRGLNETGIVEGAIDYLSVLLSPRGMGPLLGSLGLAGAVRAITSRNRPVLLLLAYGLPFALVSILTYPGYAEPRHQIPLYPALALAGAFLTAAAFRFLERRNARYTSWLGIGLAVLLLQPAWALAARAVERSRPESRNAALAWIEKHIPPGTKLVVDANGPPLLPSSEILRERLRRAAAADPKGQFTAHETRRIRYLLRAAKGRPTYHVFEIRKVWWRDEEPPGVHYLQTPEDFDMGNPLIPYGVAGYDDYVREGYVYAVVHSEAYRPYVSDTLVARKKPGYTRFYRELFKRGELVARFGPTDGFSGPEVRIYRLRP